MIQRKCAQLPPNQTAAILEANMRHHNLVVTMSYTRHHSCRLQKIAAHERTPHSIQSFACLQKAAIADELANHSATKTTASKKHTVTKVRITAPVSIKFAGRTGHQFNYSI
jgi:hypothetical protein